MINSIFGTITEVLPSKVCIATQSGVEYSLLVSNQAASYFASLQEDGRKNIKILTHLVHREDALVLYGFLDENERKAFLSLVKISGVGPSLALKILSGMRAETLSSALDKSDVKFLSSIPGLGSKTAIKLIQELRGKLVISQPDTTSTKEGNKEIMQWGDIICALCDMGFDKKTVERQVKLIAEANRDKIYSGEFSEEDMFRSLLKDLKG